AGTRTQQAAFLQVAHPLEVRRKVHIRRSPGLDLLGEHRGCGERGGDADTGPRSKRLVEVAEQVEAGAPADVYFSADLQWMSYLQERGLLRPGSRHDVVGNSLVLIAPAASALRVSIAPGFDLSRLLGGGHLAVADPDSVPAGIYAREALQKLGAWDSVVPHLVRAENVRAALAYVARGDAPLGIVYRTDALVQKGVRIVGVFPASSHSPIVYPVALTRGASNAAARYLAFIVSADARPVFRKWGFEPLPLR